MRDEKNYSLCLALPDQSDTSSYYRIADYSPELRRFTPASYEPPRDNPLWMDSTPGEKGVAHQAELRRWWLREDNPNQHFSEHAAMRHSYIYEIVFLDEMIHQPLSDSERRQVFYDGIELPTGINQSFLLTIDVTTQGYITLLCNKKAFKKRGDKYYIEKKVSNLEDAVTSFPQIDIYLDEFLSTEKLKQKLNWYEEPVRYFYNSAILSESSNKFLLRNPEDYVVVFFKNYLYHESDRKEYSNQERSDLLTELELIENEHDLIKRFLSNFKMDEPSLITRFKKNISNIIEYTKSMSANDQELLLDILSSNPELTEIYEEKIENRWMSKFNQNILDKENELAEVQTQHDELFDQLDDLRDKLEEVMKEYAVIKEECVQKEIHKKEIQKQIEEELMNFQNNIVDQYKLSALQSHSLTSIQDADDGIIYTSSGPLSNLEAIEINTIEDVVKGIESNLGNIMGEETEQLSSVCCSIFLHNKVLILPEFQSEGIATSLSLILTGKPVEIFNLVNENYSLNYIINKINDSENSMFLINGLLDTLSETALFTLINQCPDSRFIFTVNNEKVLSMFSDNLWNYCIYVNVMDSIDPFIEEYEWKYLQGSVNLADFEIKVTEIPKNFYKKFDSHPLFNRYAQEEFLSILDHYNTFYKKNFDSQFDLSSMSQLPLNHQLLLSNYEKLPELESYFKEIGIDEKLIECYK